MAASVNDKLTDTRNAARPNAARVSSGRSGGATTLACDNLAGWPTASKVHFVTYQIDSSSEPVPGTQLDCSGIVSGNNIGSLTVIDGSDTGNAVNDVVEMLPTAAWGQDLADALTAQHSRTGTHKSITTDTISVSSGTTLPAGDIGTADIATAAVTNAKLAADISPANFANPYKFFAYLNVSGQTLASVSATKVTLNAEAYDTGSNFDTATNYRFTAPVAGFYQIDATANTSITSANVGVAMIYKNGTALMRADAGTNSTVSASPHISALIQLAASDYLELWCINTFGSGATLNGGTYGSTQVLTYMSGYLVSTT